MYKILEEKTKSIPGALVENNKFCLSVHYRCVDEKVQSYIIITLQTKSIISQCDQAQKLILFCFGMQLWPTLADTVRSVLNEYPKLKLTQGRKVLEIRPTIKWDKGKALEFLLESLGEHIFSDIL